MSRKSSSWLADLQEAIEADNKSSLESDYLSDGWMTMEMVNDKFKTETGSKIGINRMYKIVAGLVDSGKWESIVVHVYKNQSSTAKVRRVFYRAVSAK